MANKLIVPFFRANASYVESSCVSARTETCTASTSSPAS
jgi:hypothetical protein